MASERRDEIAVTIRTGLILVAGCVLLWALSDIFLLLFAAILLAVMMRGMARQLSRVTRLPVALALGIVALAAIAGLGSFAYLLGPRFVDEGEQLFLELTGYAGHLQAEYGQTPWGQAILHSLSFGKLAAYGTEAPQFLTDTFGTFGAFALMLITALYLAISPRLYTEGVIRLLPKGYRSRAAAILAEITNVLRSWMLGQLIDMAVVGVLSTIGLLTLGVPLPIALGVLAGLLTFIPYVGAILAGIPAVLVASTMGPATVLWVVLLYFGCHMLEGYIVAPLVTRRMVHMAPALTVLSMSILGMLYGFLGVLIATPLTAAMIVLVNEIYVQDILHDETV